MLSEEQTPANAAQKGKTLLTRRYAAALLAAAGTTMLAGLSATTVRAVDRPSFGWPGLEVGFKRIYDGSNLSDWKQAGPGGFIHSDKDGSILSDGGMGLLWYPLCSYRNFVLRVDWKVERPEANSGVFVRFPDPQGDPWKPVNEGYEIQICDSADPKHRTGSVYSFAEAADPPTKPVGQWNTLEIRVAGQNYRISVNGKLVCQYTGDRSTEGYIGLQNHGSGDKVWFRNIRIRPLLPTAR